MNLHTGNPCQNESSLFTSTSLSGGFQPQQHHTSFGATNTSDIGAPLCTSGGCNNGSNGHIVGDENSLSHISNNNMYHPFKGNTSMRLSCNF